MMDENEQNNNNCRVRKIILEDLEARALNNFDLAERFKRKNKIRRKPRSPEETAILSQMVISAVRKAKNEGRLWRSEDGRLHIKL